MATDWILRVGDGKNLKNSSKYKIWGIQTTTASSGKYFVKNVKLGDRLWFVKGKTNGKILAVATYSSHNTRDTEGPLINCTMTNEQLGWTGSGSDWTSNVEIHYRDLYSLENCNLLTYIKGPGPIRKYSEKCRVDLASEYNYIKKYRSVSFEL